MDKIVQKLALVALAAHHGLLPRLKTAAFRFLHYYELTYTRKSTHYCFLAKIDYRVVSFFLLFIDRIPFDHVFVIIGVEGEGLLPQLVVLAALHTMGYCHT